MSTSFSVLASAALASLLLGCATHDPNAERGGKNANLPVAERVTLSFDDPKPIFTPVFQGGDWFKKGELENTDEYRQRLDGAGVQGKRVTFLIAPEFCEISSLPDKQFYLISAGSDGARMVTISRTTESLGKSIMQNAFGAAAEVSHLQSKTLALHMEGFKGFPLSLRWRVKDKILGYSYFVDFGLAIHPPDAATDSKLRELLKDKKIGLAVRGTIGDLAKSEHDIGGMSPTIDAPTSLYQEVFTLPFVLEDAYIIDTSTGFTIAGWHRNKI